MFQNNNQQQNTQQTVTVHFPSPERPPQESKTLCQIRNAAIVLVVLVAIGLAMWLALTFGVTTDQIVAVLLAIADLMGSVVK